MMIPEKALPLIFDMHKYLTSEGFSLTYGEVFLKLIEANMMDEEGNVTEFAIKNGLVEMIN